MKRLISIAVLMMPIVLFAQKDSTKLSFKKYFLPTGVRVGTDAISLAKNIYDDSFSGWEANVDLDFYRYYLTIDYGNWGRLYTGDGLRYSNNGNYFRAGVDVNFLAKDTAKNMFFLGARYGKSVFSEDFTFTDMRADEVIERTYSNRDVPAHWYELTTGVRIKIWSFIWMGYTARFKFGLKTGDTPEMIPHDVPGYGRTDKDSYWGFNYQIFVRIPVRKTPPPPPSRKKKK